MKHAQHYFDLNPQHREPSTLAVWSGAALAVLFIWAACYVAFVL